MLQDPVIKVTILFYEDKDLTLHHETHELPVSRSGRIIIPENLKEGRSIIAVCEGKVDILNKLGDRIMPLEGAA